MSARDRRQGRPPVRRPVQIRTVAAGFLLSVIYKFILRSFSSICGENKARRRSRCEPGLFRRRSPSGPVISRRFFLLVRRLIGRYTWRGRNQFALMYSASRSPKFPCIVGSIGAPFCRDGEWEPTIIRARWRQHAKRTHDSSFRSISTLQSKRLARIPSEGAY